jgi:DNA repair exonuclease SbcCD ATPase subunit
VGSNGAGKSTASDVIKFGLYGRVDNKKLRDLPNRFNNAASVKIAVEKNKNTIVTVERGIAPNFFRVLINGVEYDQAGKKNVQDYLEEEILGIPYYVFNNMISLSINDFKSFISMSANDKRMIIDRMFGLEIIGQVKWKVKYKLKLIKEYLDNLDTEISVLERSMNKSMQELDSLNEKIESADTEKKLDLTEKIKNYSEFINHTEEKIKSILEKESETRKAIRQLQQSLLNETAEERACDSKISLYESGKCPTCESDLTSHEHKEQLNEYYYNRSGIKDLIFEIKENIEKLEAHLSKFAQMHKELISKKSAAETYVSSWITEIKKMESSNGHDNLQTDSLLNIIEDAKVKKSEATVKKNEKEKNVKILRIVEEIFGDKGVKLSALKRIMPLLNGEIKKVMHDLNMDYRVTFNEEFDVSIQHLGFNVSPDQLSTGERKKIDFATLIALIRLMKVRFAGINLTFLDEIFSSIDADGIHHILNVLRKISKELNLNIFVINHSQLPVEIFDYKIDIVKSNGFSNLSIEKIS